MPARTAPAPRALPHIRSFLSVFQCGLDFTRKGRCYYPLVVVNVKLQKNEEFSCSSFLQLLQLLAMWRVQSVLRNGIRSLAMPSARGATIFSLPTRVNTVVPAILSVRVLDSQAWPESPPLLTILGIAGLAAALAQEPLTWDAHCAPTDFADQPGYVIDPAVRRKYGRYLPWCRLNVDQVPLPFVNDMETTYEEHGVSRVTINQGGPSLGKRQATGQLCFRPMVPPPAGCTNAEARALYNQYLQEQPAPCIIFRGQGINITDFERDAYPEGLVVLWQQKAWVDRPLAKEWVEDVIQPFIEAER